MAQVVAQRRTVQSASKYVHLGRLILDYLGTLLVVQTCIQDIALFFADGQQRVLLRVVEVFLRSRCHGCWKLGSDRRLWLRIWNHHWRSVAIRIVCLSWTVECAALNLGSRTIWVQLFHRAIVAEVYRRKNVLAIDWLFVHVFWPISAFQSRLESAYFIFKLEHLVLKS